MDIPPPSAKSRFWVRVSMVILMLLGAANVFLMLFIVPKFEQIYADALPGRPLPPITIFVITARIVLAIIALGWPILGAVLVQQQKRSAILWNNIGIVWCFLQIGVTTIALFLPMVGTITGMSNIKS